MNLGYTYYYIRKFLYTQEEYKKDMEFLYTRKSKKRTGCGKLFFVFWISGKHFPSEYLISMFLYLFSLNTRREISSIIMHAQKGCDVLVKDI